MSQEKKENEIVISEERQKEMKKEIEEARKNGIPYTQDDKSLDFSNLGPKTNQKQIR